MRINTTLMKMYPVVHFEMPYENRERMAEFYHKAFGWHCNLLGPEMGEYVVVMTSEEDPETKRPQKAGMINGGFYKKPEDKMGQAPSVVIATDNIKDSMKQVTEAGGTILGESMEIPGVGLYVSFIDTEGNRASMLEPKAM